MLENLKNLIAEGKTLDALHQLHRRLRPGSDKRQVLALINQWERNEQKRQSELLFHNDSDDFVSNRITLSLLDIIEKLTEKDLQRWAMTGLWVAIGFTTLGLSVFIFSAFYWLTQPFKLSINVVGEDGQHIEQLNGKAYLRMIHVEETEPVRINHNGIAHFGAIPALFRRDSLRIGILRKDGVSFDGDSSYVVGFAQSVTLRVRPWKWDRVEGRIRDAQTLLPIVQAEVVYKNVVATTDKYGYFKMDIPRDKQFEDIILMVQKEGYAPMTGKATPQTGESFDKNLNKLKR